MSLAEKIRVAEKMRVYYCNDMNISIEFARDCVEQLNALEFANNAGFVDDSGREWTLSKCYRSNNDIEIRIKCRKIYDQKYKKFVTKQAHIYPLNQRLHGNMDDGHLVNLDNWCINVNTRLL
jgi:hypothetical protein